MHFDGVGLARSAAHHALVRPGVVDGDPLLDEVDDALAFDENLGRRHEAGQVSGDRCIDHPIVGRIVRLVPVDAVPVALLAGEVQDVAGLDVDRLYRRQGDRCSR